MNREDVISKVRKLFELSSSSNENEAALAAAKARELLSRYNLSMADVPADEMKGLVSATQTSVQIGKVLHSWVRGLLVYISRWYECEHIIHRRRGLNLNLLFIGAGADAEIAAYTFQFMRRELERLLENALPRLKRENRYWSGTALRYAYLDGAVKRIGERFQKHTENMMAAEREGCKELVLVKQEMIKSYMAKAFPRIRREHGKSRIVNAGAFNKGYSDAGSLDLRPGIREENPELFVAGTSCHPGQRGS